MAETNGIRIPTKVDLTGLKKGLAEMRKELAQAEKEYANLEREYKSEAAKYEKEIAKGGPAGANALEQQLKVAERYGKKLDALTEKIKKYKSELATAESYHDRVAGAADASKQVDQAMAGDKFVSGITSQEKYNSLLSQTRAQMAAMEAHAARIAAKTGISAKDILRQNDAYQKAASTAKLLETRSDEISDNIKRAEKNAKLLDKATKKVGASTKSGIAGFGKMGLALMAMRFAMRAISAATREYMATNSELEGQLNTLKSLWGQVLGPAIEWVINLLMKAVSAVNAFVQALTGINLVARANEAALKKQAKATSGAAKAAQLAGFDEQTKLSDSSGGDPVATLNDSIASIPQKLRELIQGGDWYGAGKFVGEALMDGIEDVDWNNIGSKIGEVLGGAVAFAVGFALSLDPMTILTSAMDLAAGLLDSLADAIQKMDWLDIGKQILDLLIFALVMSQPIGQILAVMLTPEGTEMAKSASELVGSIIGALATAIVGMAQRVGELALELWNTLKTYFDDYVNWDGTAEEIIQGLWAGIVDALKNVGEWMYNNVWVPFRDGFKAAFGIDAAESEKMREFGANLINGLRDGIINGISKIKQACADIRAAIEEKFSGIGDWFKNKFSDAWSKVKEVFSTGGKIFDGIKEGISSTFKTIVNGLIDGINKIIKTPFNSINSMLNTIRSVSVLGITPFKNLWSYNPLSVPQIPKLALGGIVNRPGSGVPAIIGEAGPEAVLPLDGPNADAWMDILADKIGGNVTIPIYMDGKKIATYVVDIQKKKAFAMNGA